MVVFIGNGNGPPVPPLDVAYVPMELADLSAREPSRKTIIVGRQYHRVPWCQPKEQIVPKHKDIKKILIIGSGPIVIGQGCEFDYSGTQACKVLKQQGFKVVLVNSNPATIMTDPEMADAT